MKRKLTFKLSFDQIRFLLYKLVSTPSFVFGKITRKITFHESKMSYYMADTHLIMQYFTFKQHLTGFFLFD